MKKSQSIAGVGGLIQSAIAKETNKDATYFFGKGDLSQTAAEKALLQQNGIPVFMNDVYPCVKTKEEYERGLKLIWEKRCEGWWNYKATFIEYKICTPEEYATALDAAS